MAREQAASALRMARDITDTSGTNGDKQSQVPLLLAIAAEWRQLCEVLL